VKDAEPIRSRMPFNADNYITINSIANLLPSNVIVVKLQLQLQLQYEFA